MKRFYCLVCRRIKHCRTLPGSVVNSHAPQVENRLGVCKFHTDERGDTVNSRSVTRRLAAQR